MSRLVRGIIFLSIALDVGLHGPSILANTRQGFAVGEGLSRAQRRGLYPQESGCSYAHERTNGAEHDDEEEIDESVTR